MLQESEMMKPVPKPTTREKIFKAIRIVANLILLAIGIYGLVFCVYFAIAAIEHLKAIGLM